MAVHEAKKEVLAYPDYCRVTAFGNITGSGRFKRYCTIYLYLVLSYAKNEKQSV